MLADYLPVEVAYCRNRSFGAEFDDDRAPNPLQPTLAALALRPGAPFSPTLIVEHQYVRARDRPAVRARRGIAEQAASQLVHRRKKTIGRPDRLAARRAALQVMNRPVTLVHLERIETGQLELSIHITGEHAAAMRLRLGPLPY